LLLLAGASASILIAGTQDVWSIVVFLSFASLGLLFIRPTVRPSAVPLVLVALFCSLCLLAFLPQDYFPVPEWRAALMNLGTVPLAESVNPQPWQGWFWWSLLAGACLVFSAMLTAPLETKSLAIVLHAAAAFVAICAVLAIGRGGLCAAPRLYDRNGIGTVHRRFECRVQLRVGIFRIFFEPLYDLLVLRHCPVCGLRVVRGVRRPEKMIGHGSSSSGSTL
jgi:hypothetical protein